MEAPADGLGGIMSNIAAIIGILGGFLFLVERSKKLYDDVTTGRKPLRITPRVELMYNEGYPRRMQPAPRPELLIGLFNKSRDPIQVDDVQLVSHTSDLQTKFENMWDKTPSRHGQQFTEPLQPKQKVELYSVDMLNIDFPDLPYDAMARVKLASGKTLTSRIGNTGRTYNEAANAFREHKH